MVWSIRIPPLVCNENLLSTSRNSIHFLLSIDNLQPEWHPYFEAPDFGLLKTSLKGASWAVEELTLQVASTVVGLQSLTGDFSIDSHSADAYSGLDLSHR